MPRWGPAPRAKDWPRPTPTTPTLTGVAGEAVIAGCSLLSSVADLGRERDRGRSRGPRGGCRPVWRTRVWRTRVWRTRARRARERSRAPAARLRYRSAGAHRRGMPARRAPVAEIRRLGVDELAEGAARATLAAGGGRRAVM